MTQDLKTVKLGGIAFIAAFAALVAYMVLANLLDTHPAESSVDIFVSSVNGLPGIFIAMGMTAVIVAIPTMRRGIAGFLAVGFLWLAATHHGVPGRDAAIRVRYLQEGRADLLVDGTVPWYVGGYDAFLLFGVGVGFLGLALTRTQLVRPFFGRTGMALGWLFAAVSFAGLVAVGRGDLGILWPAIAGAWGLTMVWVLVLGFILYRHGRSATTTERAPDPAGTELNENPTLRE